jgi:hypothetical protein
MIAIPITVAAINGQFEFDTLATAAFKGERVAARRLAARNS